MQTCVHSAVIQGMEVIPVRVEVDVMRGLPGFYVVGLPGSSIREARERVRSSFVACEKDYPMQRLVINLVPGNVPKQSTHFDLPIAVGLLAATGQVSQNMLAKTLFVGELSLQGNIEAVQGAFLLIEYAQKAGFEYICLPYANVQEAMMIEGIQVCPARHLREVCTFIETGNIAQKITLHETPQSAAEPSTTFQHVIAQDEAKYALMIAAAGGHNILLSGPPGCGKTMLARSIRDILPPLSLQEQRDVLRVYSAAGKLQHQPIVQRPFRIVYPTTTKANLLGGGLHRPVPGEVSLAHRGVLVLDELPEFSREHIELLREPLESRTITVRRHDVLSIFPAASTVIATMNPCTCGFFGSTQKECICTDHARDRYRRKISGPIRDRFDMMISMGAPLSGNGGTSTALKSSLDLSAVRLKVLNARKMQLQRNEVYGIMTNSDIPVELLETLCLPDRVADNVLTMIVEKHRLSLRGRSRILKVARTIADLAGVEEVREEHIFEAVHFRGQL